VYDKAGTDPGGRVVGYEVMGVITNPKKAKKRSAKLQHECDFNMHNMISTRKVQFPPEQCDFTRKACFTLECNTYETFECNLYT
jgi:hypothetical protein